ncbi:MAG: hypothetical protein V7K26_28485 [Nostoc sp.]|uniref:hypothetical protein n=1 Tax=Nostoc sp. TaxID=1180 RepID=UPI002FF0DA10
MLKQISDSVETDIQILRNLQEDRLVLKPLTQSAEVNDDAWIETRYKVLTQDAEVVTKIKDASDKLTKLKEIFIASIEGDLTTKRLDNFIQETNSFSALLSN